MKCKTFILLFLVVSSSLISQTKNITSSMVQYVSGRDTVSAYLSIPEEKDTFPAVILIHEWWGLNDWMKQNARSFAKRGYVTLAIDLYRGNSTTLPDEAHELMRGLPEDRVLRDLKAAFQYMKQQKKVEPTKIGIVGWCMGGGYSLTAAVNIPELAACVICYGRLVTDSTAIKSISCPVLGIFGDADRGIFPKDVKEFETLAQSLGKNVQTILYPNARHAFMNPNNESGYSVNAASEAWKRIFDFIDKSLLH